MSILLSYPRNVPVHAALDSYILERMASKISISIFRNNVLEFWLIRDGFGSDGYVL